MPSKAKHNPRLQPEKLQIELIGLLSREWLNSKDTQRLKQLIDLNPLDSDGNPAILVLVCQQRWECIRKLAELGVDLHTADQAGTTVAIAAAIAGRLDILQLVTPHPQFPEKYHLNVQISGNTPIMYFAKTKKWDIVKGLAELGADLNIPDQDGVTILMAAVESGNLLLIETLVQKGADVVIQTPQGISAWGVAEHLEFYDIVFFLEDYLSKDMQLSPASLKLKELLRKKDWSENEESAMHELCQNGLNADSLVAQVPAIVYAVYRKNVRAAELLIKYGADKKCLSIKQKNINQTLLYYFMKDFSLKKHGNIVKFLFDCGVDPDVASLENAFVLIEARQIRNVSFVKMLEEYDAKRKLHNEEKTNRDQFLKFKLIKESGHILGLNGKIDDVDTNGYYTFESYNLFKKLINIIASSMLNTPCSKRLQDFTSKILIREPLDLAIEWLKADGTIMHQDLMKHYNSGLPIILPISLKCDITFHAFPVIIWNNIIIVCNRGLGKLEHGISVFKMLNTEHSSGKLTADVLETLIPQVGLIAQQQFFINLNKLADLSNPILSFYSKDHLSSTCTFSNLKSSMKPLMFFINLLEHAKVKYEKFDYDFLEPYLEGKSKNKILKIIMPLSAQYYKELSTHIRDKHVEELCKAYQAIPVDSESQQEIKRLYLKILHAIVDKHNNRIVSLKDEKPRKEKIESDRLRIEKILDTVPKELCEMVKKMFHWSATQTNDAETISWLQKLSDNCTIKNLASQEIATFHLAALVPNSGIK